VDRNYYCDHDTDWIRASLSARRAWIEITALSSNLKEIKSLSARRAWIEIVIDTLLEEYDKVALRKESVDRNFTMLQTDKTYTGRSPQGERG